MYSDPTEKQGKKCSCELAFTVRGCGGKVNTAGRGHLAYTTLRANFRFEFYNRTAI